jgi:ACS family glucarate transporter-like MFS transporter
VIQGRLRWALTWWIFVVSAIAYLDRVNISIAGQFIQKDLNLDNTQLGWVFSAFVLGYALFQAPAGRLADRIGPRKSLAGAAIWWAVFSALTTIVSRGLANALAILIGVRFLLGVGESIMYPASNRFVARWIPTEERGRATGIVFAGVGAGAGISPPLITWVVLHEGWKTSFFVSAVIGLVGGAAWYLLARDEPAEHPAIGAEELAHIRSGIPGHATSAKGQSLSWSAILSNRNVLLLIFSYSTFGYTVYIFFSWLFIYLSKVRGLDLKSSALYSILPFLSMSAGSALGGVVSDHLSRKFGKRIGRCVMATVALFLCAFFVALATQVADARLASVVLAGGAFALYLSSSSFWSVSADIAGCSAGSLSGVMNMGCQMAGALTASLTPYLASHYGWSVSFQTAAALCAAGALAWLLVDPECQLEAEERPVLRADNGAIPSLSKG